MQAQIEQYLSASDTEERGRCVSSVMELIKGGQGNVLHIVQALQDWLISEDESRRALGTRLLTDVVSAGSGVLAPGDVHHLAHFLTARLMDWPCVEQAALGCTALLQHYSSRHHQASHSTLSESDALMIVRTAATGMAPQVQALAQPQRSACLRLLLLAIQAWGPEALCAAQRAGAESIGGGLNLLEAAIAAVDGEKDPRCLLASFQLLQAAVKVYHAPGVNPSQLSAQAEEVVEVLSCYFPVSFTPPKNDPFKITRDDLARGLQACMASSPFLARWLLPLVLEKLSSTYRPAKEDALSALATCCCSYGFDALQPHLPAVWSALRNEVVVAPSAFGVVGGEELNTKRNLAAKAATCLTHIMANVPPAAATLQHLATKDACVQDLLTLIEGSNGSGSSVNKGSDPDRPDRVVMCNASLLGAVCGGSVAACEHVLSTLLPRILAMLPPSADASSHEETMPLPTGPDQVAVTRSKSWASTKVMYCLTVVRDIVHGVESALQASGPHSCAELSQNQGSSSIQQLCLAYLGVLVPRLVDPITHTLSEALHAVGPACLGTAMQVDDEGDAAEGGNGGSTDAAPQVLLACISLWRALLSLHCTCSLVPAPGTSSTPASGLLSQAQLTDCVHAMIRWALVTDESKAGASPGGASSGDEDTLPEGVVTAAPFRMEWKAPQAAHLEALALLQQALAIAEGREVGGSASSSSIPGDAMQGVSDATQSGSALQGYVLQQLCIALLGSSVSTLPATDDRSQEKEGLQSMQATASLPATRTIPHPASTSHPGSSTANGMDVTSNGARALEHVPPPQPVRARALHAASTLSVRSPSLALALQAMVSPLLLQLLTQQAAKVEVSSLITVKPWAAVTQELLVLVGQQLPPAWPQPLPPHHAAALTAFVTTLLELPLGSALLCPGAAAAAATTETALCPDAEGTTDSAAAAAAAAGAGAAKQALAAVCAPCSNLTARCSADEQRGVALSACEAVAYASSSLQDRATATAAHSPPAAVLGSAQTPSEQQQQQQQQQQHSQGGSRTDLLQPARSGVSSDAQVVGDLARSCAACSAFTGLQPSVLAGAHSVLQLVDALCDLATGRGFACLTSASDKLPQQQQQQQQGAEWAHNMVTPDLVAHELQRAAAIALASILNKWPGPGEELEGLACRVLRRWGLLQLLPEAKSAQEGMGSSSSGVVSPADTSGAHWQALAWTARALAMRGSSLAPALLQHAVDCLAHSGPSAPSNSTAAAHQQRSATQQQRSSMSSLGPAAPAANEGMAVDEGPQLGKDNTALHVSLGGGSWGLAAAGASFFRIVVSGAGDGAWHHARTRVLWQQRMLATCLGPLLSALGRTPTPPPDSVATTALPLPKSSMEADPKGGQNAPPAVPARHALLLAFASVVGSVQLGMLRIEAPRIVDPLLAALHELPALAGACKQLKIQQAGAKGCGAGGKEEQRGGSADDVPADMHAVQQAQELEGQLDVCLEGAARVLEQLLLCDVQLRPLLEEHVERLIGCLTLLMGYQGWPAVRETALRCAMLLLDLPYHLLHPHRLLIIRGVTKALDDDKRSVRLLAVRCRRCWVPK